MPIESTVKIKEVIQRTHNVRSIRLEKVEETAFEAGQFLSISLGEGKDLTHYLSISNSPTESGYIEVTKKVTDSPFSKRFNSLKNGDEVKIKYPFGKFIYNTDYKKIAFLSGGIGITPIRSISKFIIDKGFGTDMTLLYGNRSTGDITFKEDFDIMEKTNENLKVVHVISQFEEGCKGKAGNINEPIIKEDIPDYKERKFYMCGPPAMVSSMKYILTDNLKVPLENIITENFTGY